MELKSNTIYIVETVEEAKRIKEILSHQYEVRSGKLKLVLASLPLELPLFFRKVYDELRSTNSEGLSSLIDSIGGIIHFASAKELIREDIVDAINVTKPAIKYAGNHLEISKKGVQVFADKVDLNGVDFEPLQKIDVNEQLAEGILKGDLKNPSFFTLLKIFPTKQESSYKGLPFISFDSPKALMTWLQKADINIISAEYVIKSPISKYIELVNSRDIEEGFVDNKFKGKIISMDSDKVNATVFNYKDARTFVDEYKDLLEFEIHPRR